MTSSAALSKHRADGLSKWTTPLPAFFCSLTHDVMIDPVIITATGQTYEREAIELWLRNHDTCPLSGINLLGSRQITPNISLRNSIDEWKDMVDKALKWNKHEVSFEEIEIESMLVSTRTKEIFKGTFLKTPVAICILKNRGGLGDREADILSSIGKHPNIVRFIARSTDKDGRGVIILELAPSGGNLFGLIAAADDDPDGKLSDKAILTILNQIVDGMEELNANGIVHKDLATRNILVFAFDKDFPERIRVKISDFGMSSFVEETTSYYYSQNSETKALPIRWMAPESLIKNKWSEKSDVYSFGVLIWEMLSGASVPWGLALSDGAVQAEVRRGETLPCEPTWSRGLVEVFNRCCRINPKDRLTFAELKVELQRLMNPPKESGTTTGGGGGAGTTVSPIVIPPPLRKEMQIKVVSYIKKFEISALFVEPSDTIANVKLKIGRSNRVFNDQQYLTFAGKKLEDDRTLLYYNIVQDSEVHLLWVPGPRKMQIFFRGMGRKIVTLEFSPIDTIDIVREKVAALEGVKPDQIRLITEGKQLENGRTLADYDILREDRIDVAHRLTGDIGFFGTHANSPGIDLLNAAGNALLEYTKVKSDSIREIVLQVRAENLLATYLDPYFYFSENNRVLDSQACFALRNLLDDRWSKGNDNGVADFKLDIQFNELCNCIGTNATNRLSEIVHADFDKIILRRCVPEGLCIKFHLDESQQVMQVVLNGDEEYEGARLVFATDDDGGGLLHVPRRPEGSYTVHNHSVVHGVSKHEAGVRYSLFFLKSAKTVSD